MAEKRRLKLAGERAAACPGCIKNKEEKWTTSMKAAWGCHGNPGREWATQKQELQLSPQRIKSPQDQDWVEDVSGP